MRIFNKYDKPSTAIADMTNRVLFSAPFIIIAVLAVENGLFSSQELILGLGFFICTACLVWIAAVLLDS